MHYPVAQTQLMPILAHIKAQIVQPYVFFEERHLEGGELCDADARLRLER